MTEPLAPPRAAPAFRAAANRRAWPVVLAVVLAVIAAYADGLRGPFVFDDIPSIPENASIRQVWPVSLPLSPPGEGQTVTGRPVLNLSFAINRALTGSSPAGYRAMNIGIHAIAGLLLFGLVRRTFPRLNETGGAPSTAGDAIALAAAAMWLMHPAQTAAVTYIVQRAESLMALFYLLALYTFARAAESARPLRWLAVTVASCALGMGTKEVMVSAPVLILVYDRLFVARSWRALLSRRRWFYVTLATTWILLAALVLHAGFNRGGSTGVAHGISPAQYWATQLPAIAHYLGLAFWPTPLVLDHGAEWVRNVWQLLPGAVVIAALAGATIAALRQGSPAGFLGLWFFAVLAPTSLFPGTRQTMADQRPYLALAPVAILAAFAIHRCVGRRALLAGLAALVGLGALTARRNLDYCSVLGLWADTVRKRPDNAWAQVNYGSALADAGRAEEAVGHFERAVQIDPDNAMAHYDLGSALLGLGRLARAITHLTEAIRLNPGYAAARTNLADALFRAGRYEDAVVEYRGILQSGRDTAETHYNLGNALLRAGRTTEAVDELSTALRRRPDYAEAHYNLGLLLLQQGRFDAAAEQFEATLRIHPDDSDAHNNLANALAPTGRITAAIQHAREAIRLNPANAQAHASLGLFQAYTGARQEAVRELTEALRLAPDDPAIRTALQQLGGTGD